VQTPPEDIPWPPLKPGNPEASDFIKPGSYYGPDAMAAVFTKAEKAEVKALKVDLDSALTRINVSSTSNFYLLLHISNQLSFAENH
jgi:hypothetical protein